MSNGITWRRRTATGVVLAITTAATMLVALPAAADTPGGAAKAWGAGASGQLGNGGTADVSSPANLNLPTGGGTSADRVLAVAGGASHSLVLRADGTVWGTGLDTDGQVDGIPTSPLNPNKTAPVKVGLPLGVTATAIAAGANHSLALGADGNVYAWGRNDAGQLGTAVSLGGVQTISLKDGNGTTVRATAIAAGTSHSLALGEDHRVYAWGSNLYGQLGNGNPLPPSSATPLTVAIPAGAGDVTSIAAGANHSLAVAGGHVYAWGNNGSNELADPLTSGRSTPIPVLSGSATPSSPFSTATMVAVAGGRDHSLALDASGTVWSFGSNNFGQLGRTDTAVAGPVANLSGVYAIASHGDHNLALKADGTVASWGNNSNNQLGRSLTLGATSTASAALIPNATSVVAIATGDGHSLSVRTPTASVAPASIAFPDQLPGHSSPPQTITVSNTTTTSGGDTGAPLYVGTPVSTDADFAVTATTCTGAITTSCTITVVFTPADPNPNAYSSTLTIPTNAFPGTLPPGPNSGNLTVALTGRSAKPSGTLTVTADEITVPATPSSVPVGSIPLQPNSPAYKSTGGLPGSGLGIIGPLGGSGLGLIGPLPGSGLGLIGGLPGSGLGIIGPLSGSGLGIIGGLPGSGLGLIGPLPGSGLGLIPLAQQSLDQVYLSQLPITYPGGWQAMLAGTALAGLPLNTVTYGQVFRLDPQPAGMSSLTISDLMNFTQTSNSAFGRIPFFGLYTGTTPVNAMTLSGDPGWCPRVQAQGFANCGAALSHNPPTAAGPDGSIVELALAGFNFGLPYVDGNGKNWGPVPTATIPMRDISFAPAAPMLSLLLTSITNLHTTDLGSVIATAAVADCSRIACDGSKNLDDAAAAGALKPSAAIGDLRGQPSFDGLQLGEVAFGMLPPAQNPLEILSLDQLGILGLGTSRVHYHVVFTSTATVPVTNPTVTVTLPGRFNVAPATSAVSLAGANCAGCVSDPTAAGQVYTWQVTGTVNPGAKLQLDFQARPGATLGTFAVPSATIRDTSAGFTQTTDPTALWAPVKVVEATATNTDANHAASMVTDTMYLSHVSTAGEKHYYALSISDAASQKAGTIVSVALGHQAADFDLRVFYPLNQQAYEPSLRPVPAGSRPVTSLDDTKSGSNNLDVNLPPDGQSYIGPPPCLTSGSTCQALALAGASRQRGTTTDVVQFVSPGGGGPFIVEVSGYNGASSTSPFTLRAATAPPVTIAGAARSFPYGPLSYTPAGSVVTPAAGTKTVFLLARSRIQALYGGTSGQDVATAITSVVNDPTVGPTVKGAVIDVDRDATVEGDFQRWDATPFDPFVADNVVRDINALVDRVLPAGTQLQNVVVVGGDEVIPFGRPLDPEVDGNERNFAAEMAGISGTGSAIYGALANGRMLSDSPYGTFAPIQLPGRWLYVENTAVGRLVERPQDITAALARFVSFQGKVDPHTSLTTGYDFLADSAAAVNQTLAAKLGGPNDSLISQPTDATQWRKADLSAKLTQAKPDVTSLSGHADPSRTLPPGETSQAGLYTTQDLLQAGSLAFARKLIFSVGCHSGLSIPDTTVSVGNPLAQDWSQTVSSLGGSLAGQTGFGLGSIDTIALTEQLMLSFAKNLGTVSNGQALMFAKQGYLGSAGVLDVYDEKVLMEAEEYGLPNLVWATPQSAPAAPTAPTTSVDPLTGLTAATISVAPAFTKVTPASGNGSYWAVTPSAPAGTPQQVGGLQITHDRPVMPKVSVDVTLAGTRAHGALITGLASADDAGWDPVLSRVVQNQGSNEAERQFGDASFPDLLQTVTSYRSANGDRDQLVVVPGRFLTTGTANGKTVGTMRRYTSVQSTVEYSPSSAFVPPSILATSGIVVGSTAMFTATVLPATAETVKAVLAIYKDGSGVWKTLRLLPTATANLYAAPVVITGSTAEYFVEAADSDGNVGYLMNKAFLFSAAAPPAGPAGLTVTVSGQPAPAGNGWLSAGSVTISGGTNVQWSLDSGPLTNYTSAIPVGGDGIHTVSYSGIDAPTGNPVSGTAIVPIDGHGPTVTTNPPANSVFTLRQPANLVVGCVDSVSAVATCTPAPGPLDTSTPGPHTVSIRSTDGAGNVTAFALAYTVAYTFIGFLNGVSNPPAVNSANAGRTIPMKWQLKDASGAFITSTSVVTNIGSFQINCMAPPPSSYVPTTTDPSGLTYNTNANQYVYNWATDSSWTGTCRRFVVTLNDSTNHVADFNFH